MGIFKHKKSRNKTKLGFFQVSLEVYRPYEPVCPSVGLSIVGAESYTPLHLFLIFFRFAWIPHDVYCALYFLSFFFQVSTSSVTVKGSLLWAAIVDLL